MQELNLDVAGEFLVMAATLIHIKSRTLLPRPDPTQDDGGPRRIRARRWCAGCSSTRSSRRRPSCCTSARRCAARSSCGRTRSVAEAAGDDYEPELEVDLFSLLAAFRGVLERANRRPPMVLPPEQISIEDRIAAAARAAVGDRGVRVRGSVRGRRRLAAVHDRHVPGAARDDPAEADSRVPVGRRRPDPRLQARAAGGCAASDWRSRKRSLEPCATASRPRHD